MYGASYILYGAADTCMVRAVLYCTVLRAFSHFHAIYRCFPYSCTLCKPDSQLKIGPTPTPPTPSVYVVKLRIGSHMRSAASIIRSRMRAVEDPPAGIVKFIVAIPIPCTAVQYPDTDGACGHCYSATVYCVSVWLWLQYCAMPRECASVARRRAQLWIGPLGDLCTHDHKNWVLETY